MRRALVQWGTMLWHEKLTQLQWDPEVVAFLTDRVRRTRPALLRSAPWITADSLLTQSHTCYCYLQIEAAA